MGSQQGRHSGLLPAQQVCMQCDDGAWMPGREHVIWPARALPDWRTLRAGLSAMVETLQRQGDDLAWQAADHDYPMEKSWHQLCGIKPLYGPAMMPNGQVPLTGGRANWLNSSPSLQSPAGLANCRGITPNELGEA